MKKELKRIYWTNLFGAVFTLFLSIILIERILFYYQYVVSSQFLLFLQNLLYIIIHNKMFLFLALFFAFGAIYFLVTHIILSPSWDKKYIRFIMLLFIVIFCLESINMILGK